MNLRELILAALRAEPGLSSVEIAARAGGHWATSFAVHDTLLAWEQLGLARWKQEIPGGAWLWELT